MSPYIARHDDSTVDIDAVQYTLSPTQARSESRLSIYSSSSTSRLADNGDDTIAPGDRYGSPFFWNPQSCTTERKQKLGSGVSAFFAHTWRGWRVIVFGSWVNILLVLIPVSLILPLVVPNSLGVIFILCALAMIPLVKLHDLGTRELALRIGGTKTGLLNASMSNMVELVIAISALRRCELRVVQSSLIGSILSKLLLVLGMCFFAGLTVFISISMSFAPPLPTFLGATQIHSSLLSISVGAVLLPAAYHFSIGGGRSSAEQNLAILRMSYGVSVVLLCIYVSYLLFQLWSHKHLYQDPSTQSNKHVVKFPRDVSFRPDIIGRWVRDSQQPGPAASIVRSSTPYSPTNQASSSEVTLTPSVTSSDGDKVYKGAIPAPAVNSTVKLVQLQSSGISGGVPMSRCESSDSNTSYFATSRASGDRSLQDEENEEQKSQKSGSGDEKLPQLSWPLTLLLLIVVTVLVAAIADCLVNSMDGISATVKKEWVGLILLPAVSSIAECVTAVNVSVKDQLTLSISVAVGSTIQTALFVIPFMVILARVMNKPLALLFDPFECVVLYVSVQTMTNVVADAKSSWLHGVILFGLYMIIAVAFWFYPVSYHFSEMATC